MDKKTKQHRQKSPTADELEDLTTPRQPDPSAPPGASFDTEQGRAAQGMRSDIGAGGGDTTEEIDSAMGGASDGSSGGGAAAGIPGGGTDIRTDGKFDKGNVQEDRKKIFPESEPRK
jgi:hypothetical protein